MDNPEKILIDGPAWIGDMVMAQSLFKLLKANYPNATLDVLAPSWTNPILARMPEINRAIELPFDHGELQIRKRHEFAKTLCRESYDWAILLRNSFKSALIPYWAQIKHRTGWIGEMRYGLLTDWRKLNKKAYPLMIERFMALAVAEGATLPMPYPRPSLQINPQDVEAALAAHQLNANEPVLILCPAAEYGPAKRWPAEYFAEVANAKIKDGWQVWLFGSRKDKDITQKINLLCDQSCKDLAGETSLAQAIDLMSLARAVVTNDSGLMHIAAALDRNIIAIYGSSSPGFTPPLTKNATKLSLKLDCSPCFQRECPLVHLDCLRKLRPRQVLRAIDEKLKQVSKEKIVEEVGS